MRRKVPLVGLALVWAGCAGPADRAIPAEATGGAPADVAAETGLISTLNVRVDGDSVRFVLFVTNALPDTLELEFPTAQRYEFLVDAGSGEVWRWSEGRMFAQVLGTERLAPGASREYEAVWAAGGRSGAHSAVGRLTSSNHPIELRTAFEIPVKQEGR